MDSTTYLTSNTINVPFHFVVNLLWIGIMSCYPWFLQNSWISVISHHKIDKYKTLISYSVYWTVAVRLENRPTISSWSKSASYHCLRLYLCHNSIWYDHTELIPESLRKRLLLTVDKSNAKRFVPKLEHLLLKWRFRNKKPDSSWQAFLFLAPYFRLGSLCKLWWKENCRVT